MEEYPKQSKNFKLYLEKVQFTLGGKKAVKDFTEKMHYMKFPNLVFSIFQNSFFESIEKFYMSRLEFGRI